MATWLFIERLENWRVDEHEGFTRFGLPDRAVKRASRIKAGDKLVFYVSSGVSALSDVREVTSNGVEKFPFGGDYDTAYPWVLRTRPVLTLPREKWLPMREFAERLALFPGKDWRTMMQTTMRLLPDDAGERVIRAIRDRTGKRYN